MTTTMEREDPLKLAAVRGDVEFLKNCIASNKPSNYYLTLFPQLNSHGRYYGNIFHIAACENKQDFIKEATVRLTPQAVQQLLLQQRNEDKYNPLHLGASLGNLEITKLFLHAFSSSFPLSNRKPWIERNSTGQSPCHLALFDGHEVCGLEILKMDMELLCEMVDNEGNGLLYSAVAKGLNEFAMVILKSGCSFSCSGFNGFTPLHYVTRCSEGENICRLLLEREPELIRQISNDGYSAFHIWANEGKPWPFERLLKSIDVVPDVRKIFADLTTSADYEKGSNPLHVVSTCASNEIDAVQLAQLLVDAYKLEAKAQWSRVPKDQFPWLAQDKEGWTPLSMAINNQNQNLAMYIILMDNNALMKCGGNALLLAIRKGCYEVVGLIMEIVDKRGWTELLTDDQHLNALHLAPLCKKAFFNQLLKQHPELLEGVSNDRTTILHSWLQIGKLWPFEHLLKSSDIDTQWRSQFVKLISACDYNDRNTPLHIAAMTTHEATDQIVKLLVEAYKAETHNWAFRRPASLPWLQHNKDGNGPLHLAICNKREKLALYILSLHDAGSMMELLNVYEPIHKTLFIAIEKNCFQVAKKILARLSSKAGRTKYLMDSSSERTILHLAPSCVDEEFGRWLLEEAPEFITQQDKSGQTPLDEASEVGASWFVKAILEKDSGAFSKSPLAWVKACSKGYISVLRVFIDYYPGKFSDHCIQHQDSPLHHIRLQNITGYEQFLKIPGMKDLINVQDSQGATPLHKAIRDRNILLTETLLTMDKIRYNIKDHENKAARDLLEEVCKCKEQPEWDLMCNSIGFDPRIKTTYFQHKTNLLDVRNTLSVVAALLATITFTAGFTLPGGFNQDNGEAILAAKAAFLVFLISDTLAMCCSMLVLICLIWSMVYDSNKSLFLIDRSMMLLMLALYSTLLAFMTGVYIVISPKSLWAAILIIVMCSLIGISANRTLLYKVLDKFIPSANKDPGDRIRLLEQGKACLCRGAGCLKCN